MEYIRINTPDPRRVFINGRLSGSTNALIRVEPGTHTIVLGNPEEDAPDPAAEERRAVVRGTTVDRPLVVDFE
ncbi:MAG: hypothetical protein GEU90_10940 [Gemmatimonas sp.]|nr:hypothetical protein [Gemmatimonas sp.]